MYKFIVILCLVTVSSNILAASYDPTRPLFSKQSASVATVKKSLTLETIINNSNNKSAIISGKLMKIGDYIGSHKLIAVNTSNVVLRSNDKRIKLSIFSNVVSK